MMRLSRAFWIMCAAWCVGCAHRSGPASPSQSDPAFARFVDQYFDSYFAFRPERGTTAGLHQYDRKLSDLSRERFQTRIAELKVLRARLDRFEPPKLSFDEAIDLELLNGRIRGELLELETIRSWEKNPMPYTELPGRAVHDLMKRDFAPPPERLRSVVDRMLAIPAVYRAARANLKDVPKEFTQVAIRMAKGSIGFFDKALPKWAQTAAQGQKDLLDEFEQARQAVVAATRNHSQWLEKEVLRKSSGSFAIGEANFLAKLRYDEGVSFSLPQLLARGEAQLERDYQAFVETAKRINPGKTAAEVMRSLSDDHPTADDLIPSVARSLEQARQFLIDDAIVSVPSEVRPRVEETPPFARSGGFASMSTPGPFETRATEAYYYVTPVEKDWDANHQEEHLRLYNRYVVAIINVHEAFPGHFLQFLYAPKFPTKARKLLHASSNSEGWAHYGEQMMVDEGFGGGDPKIRLAQLQEALVRDCRYLVGIKLHTQGMTVEDGARFFVEKSFQEPANAHEEARRGAFNPTYLYYTLGKLEIQELRDEFLSKRGGTLRTFHDAFVAQGAIPIPLLRKVLFH